MKRRGSARATRVWLGGLAAAGLAVSHHVGYQVAHRDAAERLHVLADTGHSYLSSFFTMCALIAVMSIVGFCAQRAASVQGVERTPFLVSTALLIFGFQASGFLVLEFGERALSGHGFTLAGSPVVIGFIVQALFAVIAAIVLRFLIVAVEFVKKLLRTPRPSLSSDPRVALVTNDLSPTPQLIAGGRGLRGPPAPLL